MSAVRHLILADAERLSAALPAYAPIVQAMRVGVKLLLIWRGHRIPPALPQDVGWPWIAIVGDDNEISYDPRAYDREGLRRLAQLAGGLAIYSGAAEAEFYSLFAAKAALGANVLVVETQLAYHAEWSGFLRAAANAPCLDIMPRGGLA